LDRKQERTIEWECQRVLRQYYQFVDQRMYKKAANLFTPDVEWQAFDVHLKGREEIYKGLIGGLAEGTIRHVITNTVIDVLDEDHAVSRSYNTDYYVPGAKVEDGDAPLHFDGPHRIEDNYAELTRTDEGWLISKRDVKLIFRRANEPIALESWAKTEGKVAPSS
jgi:hypothetical protein